MRIWMALGALNGLVGIGMGAAAAHALDAILGPEATALVRTASLYQCLHALALLGVEAMGERRTTLRLGFAGLCFAAGCAAFCGGLYAKAFFGIDAGALVPAGGLAFLAGWGCLFLAAFGRR